VAAGTLQFALNGAAACERAPDRRMKLELVDVAEGKHPADAWVCADDHEGRVVSADRAQRGAQLGQRLRVDRVSSPEIDREHAAVRGEGSLATTA